MRSEAYGLTLLIGLSHLARGFLLGCCGLYLLGFRLLRRFLERSNQQQPRGDHHARVRHIEGGPGIREGNVQVKAEEIHDIAVEETVGEVAADAGSDEGDGEATVGPGEDPFAISQGQAAQGEKGDAAKDVVRVLTAVELAKGDAGVVDMMDSKEVLDHFPPRSAQGEVGHDPVLRDLIDDVEREAQEEEKADHEEVGVSEVVRPSRAGFHDGILKQIVDGRGANPGPGGPGY